MSFTKQQVEFMKRCFDELIGERKFIETSWYAYKAHYDPLESEVRTLKNENAVQIFEYEHVAGDSLLKVPSGNYNFNIATSYGVTGGPDNFKCVAIDAEKYTIHFKYLEGQEVKIYRCFTVIPPEGGFDREYWMKWRDMQEESWRMS